MSRRATISERRPILKVGLALASLFAPVPWVWLWAQTDEGALRLLKAPKLALVVGNSAYASIEALKNPVNDAKSIAETLDVVRFRATFRLDVGREELAVAIGAYCSELAKSGAVGLFYFAGHGLQLGWRNYLVPVDARIEKAEDLQRACVDLDTLIEGVRKAANPLNVIILDACRDNPFSRDYRDVHKGLSQIDAPTNSLLAYSTAPGNVARDGESAHGVYTASLLKHIPVRDQRLEDVFKRVRLDVRAQTKGAQIPWESTSLEQDFYFLPPGGVQRVDVAPDIEALVAKYAHADTR